jgi:peptidoglycan/LPS O-acetylase OafA/YrhL
LGRASGAFDFGEDRANRLMQAQTEHRPPAQPELPPSERHLPELDGVRGIACALVVLTHCLVGQPIPQSLLSIRGVVFPIFVSGVDLFFVLSGFLIVGILLDHRQATNYFRVFWTRRVLRIFPVYFLLLATYLVALALHLRFHFQALDVWLFKDTLPAWSYALFVQNFFMAFGDQIGSYWNAITWSLAIEEQFYLLVPLLVFVLNRRQTIWLALACVVIAPILRFWPGAGEHWYYFATPCRMDALMFGVLVSCVIRDEAALNFFRRWRVAFDVAILIVFVMALDIPGYRFVDPRLHYSLRGVIGAYCILRIFLVDGGWFRAALRWRFLVNLGLISYSLYMYHQAVNGLVHGILFGAAPAMTGFPQLLAGSFVIAVSVTLAALSTRYFELPFRRKGRAFKYSLAAPAEALPLAAPPMSATSRSL